MTRVEPLLQSLEPEGQAPLGAFRRLTPTSSLLKPSARVNQNPQASWKCTWDSSSSHERSPRVGVGERHPDTLDWTVEGRAKCQSLCQSGVSNTALYSQGHDSYRQTKPRALKSVLFEAWCVDNMAGPPSEPRRTNSQHIFTQTSFLFLSVSASNCCMSLGKAHYLSDPSFPN